MANPSPTFEPDLSGRILDRYELVRRLGVGGMGAVYEAEHIALKKRVAVKLLRHDLAAQPIARRRFLREARVATRVKHPNVVDILDFGETPEGWVYFVMELLSGRDLDALIRSTPRLSWARAQGILRQVASALRTAHAHGIIHRDMKPANCFLVETPGLEDTDFVKVLDFGIAKYASWAATEQTEVLTSTDEILGTVGYMAPEVAMGRTDLRADIYAMGVMMYRMLVGELPFSGTTAFETLAKHINEPPPRPRELEPSIPVGVEAIILKALRKRVDERFQSMKELCDALELGEVPVVDLDTVACSTARAPVRNEVTEVLSDRVGVAVAKPSSTLAIVRGELGEALTVRVVAGPSGMPALVTPARLVSPAALTGPRMVRMFRASATTHRDKKRSALALRNRAMVVAMLVVLSSAMFVGAAVLGASMAKAQGL